MTDSNKQDSKSNLRQSKTNRIIRETYRIKHYINIGTLCTTIFDTIGQLVKVYEKFIDSTGNDKLQANGDILDIRIQLHSDMRLIFRSPKCISTMAMSRKQIPWKLTVI